MRKAQVIGEKQHLAMHGIQAIRVSVGAYGADGDQSQQASDKSVH
jgi:hypothetical protein